MGVHFLDTYSERIGAFKRVEITKEIKDYRSKTGRKPVLVIDALSLLYNIIRSIQLPWIAGGSVVLFDKLIRDFIRILQSSGAEVKVFFDGINSRVNTETWINRRIKDIHKCNKYFDQIDQGQLAIEIGKRLPKLYPGGWEVAKMAFMEEGCEVFSAVYDCDAEISAFVNDNECMGIIADDTDFLINCSCNIYTKYKVDYAQYTKFSKRDREVLLYNLQLDKKLLPLFATLVGNDVNICVKNNERHSFGDLRYYEYISDYMRHLNINDKISDGMLQRISLDIYNDMSKANILKKSIASYNMTSSLIEDVLKKKLISSDSGWSRILQRAFHDLRYGSGTSINFYIMADNVFESGHCCEDFRKNDLPVFQEILRPLRKKLYGILLHEQPGQHIVTEVVVDNDTKIEPIKIKATPPTVYHPGLIALWNNTNKEHNWSLLGDALEVDSLKVKNLSPYLVVPGLALRYLKDKVIMEEWEISSFILSAVIVNHTKEPSLSEMNVRRIYSRPVRLFQLFGKTISVVRLLFESLGNVIPLKATVPTNYLDGMLFHLIYNSMKAGIEATKILHLGFGIFLLSDTERCENTFKHLLHFIYED